MRKIVCGDIHGNYKGLLQCLERSGFNKQEDTLIQLGDVADGWSEVYECVEELLSIPNLISIRGNHDEWFEHWIKFHQHGSGWSQGALSTLKSYGYKCLGEDWKDFQIKYSGNVITNLIPSDIPETHRNFFLKQNNYYIDDQNRCFVHGGFNRHFSIKEQQVPYIYYWDRDLWLQAMSYKGIAVGPGETEMTFKIKDGFKEIFIGHTATINWNKTEPMQAANIYNLDTGSGFKGKLTFMDVETKEYWQSDLAHELYPNEKGR